MKNEAQFKIQFKKSVRAHHGFAISLAAPMLVGIPDLWVCIPEFMPILLEAKWIGEITRDKFSRKVPFTDMQTHWIRSCDEILPYSAMGLIGFKYKDDYRAALVKYGTQHYYQISNSFLQDCANVPLRGAKEQRHFDITDLFHQVPIPRITREKKVDINAEIEQSLIDSFI